jgi:hypothetical protein
MLKGSGSFRRKWDMFIIFLAIYNSVSIPLTIAFEPKDMSTTAFQILDSCIDLIFLIDIIIAFRTTFIDTKIGREIIDPVAIALNYVNNGLFIDFVSSMPFSDMVPTSSPDWFQSFLSMLGLLKVLRIFRISKFIRNLNVHTDIKVALKMGNLVFLNLVVMHLLGCVWFYLIAMSEEWIQNMDFIFGYGIKYQMYWYQNWFH